MAKMIPSNYKLDRTSYGEQQVFHLLEELPDSYTVFHSYSLNCHTGKLLAEIDFVVVCPLGLLCLEVKGGQIKCVDRQWFSYGQGESRPIENPFTQSQTATISLRKAVQDYFRRNRGIVDTCFASGVAFPDIVFNEKGPEIRQEIVYDLRSGAISIYIKKTFAYWSRELTQRFSIKPSTMDRQAQSMLESYLSNDFSIAYTVGTRVDQVEKETIRLTAGQRQILGYFVGNPRLLITGGAGTGKTILCLEQAQHQARAGKNVIFLCFNHNLANHLRHRVRQQQPELESHLRVIAFYKFLSQELEACNSLPPPPLPTDSEAVDNYWRQILPEAFLASPGAKQFDYLVIDEGQDLLDPLKLQCIDKLLRGGLAQGSWLAALDPLQNIYRTDLESGLNLLNRSHPVQITLEDNFRNTREIIFYTVNCTGIDPKVKPLIEGLEIREDYYQDTEEQRLKLVKALEKLKKEGIPPASICIVSLTSFQSSVLQGHPRVGKFPLQDLADLSPEEWDPTKIKFSSVYRYKGMESPVVIVTDVDNTRAEYAARCYTAMTRAKALLWVLRRNNNN